MTQKDPKNIIPLHNAIEGLKVSIETAPTYHGSVRIIRVIFQYKYIKGVETWKGVAVNFGGNNTENSVKQAVSRYLKNFKLVRLSHMSRFFILSL